MALTATQRSTRARLAAHTRWAGESDTLAATAPARKAAMSRFEREVDPDGVLPTEERTRRAKHAMKAHMTRMALRSAQSRAARTGAAA